MSVVNDPRKGIYSLFTLGARGVNVVAKPQSVDQSELLSAQNVEMVSDGGQGALTQRPGMRRINSVALDDAVYLAHDVPVSLLPDYTPYLYAGFYTGSAHKWARSAEGTTWTTVDVPALPFSNNANLALYKNIPKAVTLGRSLYFVDGSAPIGLHQWDGTTDAIVSYLPPAVSGAVLTTPATGVAENYPSVGATGYTYVVVATLGAFHSIKSATMAVTTQSASLDSTHFNVLRLVAPVPGATAYDVYRTVGGATQGKIGSVPIVAGSFVGGQGSATAFETPGAATLINQVGTPGVTTYGYKFVTRNVSTGAHSAVSAESTTGTGNASLNGVDFNRVFPPGGSFSSTDVTDVYRTTGGTSGLIGTIASGGVFNDTGQAGDGSTPPASPSGQHFADLGEYKFWDAGLVADGGTAPTTASGAAAGNALAVLDLITDGTLLYLAVLDFNAGDPLIYGRILSFNPATAIWTQVGLNFPLAAGSGCPSTLGFFDGALSFGTYTGSASGNTAYLGTTATPLPAGGIQETHSAAASLLPCCMAVFNGTLYVGYASLVAATAALIVKRTPVATWATSLTAGATAVLNAYTVLYVYNGLLFAGWTSGGGATAAIIKSTPDGVTWTTEYTGQVEEVPGQMVEFAGSLYLVMGRTGAVYNTKSRILKRTDTGTWSEVYNPSDDLAGCIGIVYL